MEAEPLPAVPFPGAGMQRWAAVFAGVLLGAFLLWPALTPAHLEGFTAALAALGIHVTQGSLAGFDSLYGLDAEYFALTKFGAVLAVAAFKAGLGVGSDLAMRLMMWTGFAALLFGTCFLARRWSGARWWFVLPLPLLVPGIVESAFVYNDNVLSAGLAALGLCLLYGRSSLSHAGAGLLLGFAVLTRTDTVLICGAVPIILWERFGASRAAVTAAAIVGLTAAAALAGPLAYFGASPFDVLRVGSETVKVWDRTRAGEPFLIIAYFLGLPGLLALCSGIGALIGRKEYLSLARLLVGPVLLLAFVGTKLWEVRQLLALAPFICALAAIGLKWLFDTPETLARKCLRPFLVALAFLSLFGPQMTLKVRDGPRVLAGRVWTIPLWRAWQQAPRSDFATLDALIRAAPAVGTQVLVADEWNEDRYLHLRLLEAGYAVESTAALHPGCRAIGERFVRGSSEILLLRLHHPLVPWWREIKEVRLGRFALPCLRTIPSGDSYFVASSTHLRALLGEGPYAANTDPADPRRDPLVAALTYGAIVALRWTPQLEQPLLAGYRREAAALPPRAKSGEALQRDADSATMGRTRSTVSAGSRRM